MRQPAHELELSEWRRVLNLNLTAVFALSKAFARPRIGAGKPGKIINIGSLMSSTARRENAPYATTKGGILLLTKALAIDWASHNILVNAIGPGFIETSLTQPLSDDPEFSAWLKKRTPITFTILS